MSGILILIFFPMLLFSQASRKNTPDKPAPYEYFMAYQLCADSACTPYLFYQVYEWIGTRYQYGGKTRKGIDCSAFVSEMYRNAYCLELCGGSKDIWPLVRPVENEDLQEGDLVFFKIRKGQISHVGLYLGNNKFAHASVHSGVIVSDLEDPYYKKHFFKGGRIREVAP